ncbi:TPA: hypothetical protein PT687_002496 [Staphylococcus aureus]|uniref:hypothetical protein n=1 Tax=Mammaliicoccus sciuri TaxID=1296 RepID=UPI000D1F466D|nr:hypothetical protein [Mammaliicoccus sciuri]PTJ52534.1 hypothetical protein BU012_04880 [Mammaliicoccus sciuri]HDK8090327.1 hypothetical protein [Staphylococcus aureus]
MIITGIVLIIGIMILIICRFISKYDVGYKTFFIGTIVVVTPIILTLFIYMLILLVLVKVAPYNLEIYTIPSIILVIGLMTFIIWISISKFDIEIKSGLKLIISLIMLLVTLLGIGLSLDSNDMTKENVKSVLIEYKNINNSNDSKENKNKRYEKAIESTIESKENNQFFIVENMTVISLLASSSYGILLLLVNYKTEITTKPEDNP